MKILVVEDDERIGSFLTKGLAEVGYFVEWAQDGAMARTLIQDGSWDLFILDVMLPDIDGFQLTQLIRYKKIDTPVLILSALGEADDKIKALDLGADDYLTKPIHFPELLSRINALRRRYDMHYSKDNVLVCADLEVNLDTHLVQRAGKEIVLSAKEFRFLVYLMENQNKVLTRSQILQVVWSTNMDTYTNVVDVYISYLRNKIDVDFPDKLIRTVKGTGYMIASQK
ncbi:response regulator transcription factor [Dyadobacter fermentans]|uniref:Two component transcriptional regulator, winged helix family n=1 Tax=Dyadobacter fermentans (strain ATCC 700827 / DSM 18053 / CIP 107007 / KCTC 52180 / NS114) TaxID=471854 RepID=C6VUR1_DYAFD|nr:response regulator transcription factor [Dyadobacter fermentans]ACT93048.1 two component transcriptional regulator, winged helix family [Dyadobacter fermentans DSM 18053]